MNHYECLKVTPDAPTEVIRAAYRALAGKSHPDRQGGSGGRDDSTHVQMVAINAAYEVLINPELRAEYDAMLAARAKAARPAPERPRPVSSSSSASEAPERDHGFSETRIDVDWVMPKPVGPAPLWPLTGFRKYLALALTLLLLWGVIWSVWNLVIRHQMDTALSVQFAQHPRALDDDEAASQDDEAARLPSSRSVMARAVEARREQQLADEMLQQQASAPARAASSPPPPGFDHQPTVTELAQLSDEQLVAILPSLGELQPAKGSFSRQVENAHHPLDGKPLNLRTDRQLIDPLALDPAAKP